MSLSNDIFNSAWFIIPDIAFSGTTANLPKYTPEQLIIISPGLTSNAFNS